MTPDRARQLYNRLPEYGADIEQLLQKLNEVYQLSIESTEERINPKLPEPVEVKVRNLAVARAVVMDIYNIHKELSRVASVVEGNSDVVQYELIKTFVNLDEDWQP